MVPHAIMFHHFHGGRHPRGQGSLSADDFQELLTHLFGQFEILDADEFQERTTTGKIRKNQICLSFDDTLLCQYDVVIPVLSKLNLKAFFFPYTSVFTDEPALLEVYRYFRAACFDDIEEFYIRFFKIFSDDQPSLFNSYLENYPEYYLLDFPFYTDNDRRFRFVRDDVLSPELYAAYMAQLIEMKGHSVKEISKGLWMSRQQVREIAAMGHTVGLHSHTHPMKMHRRSRKEQEFEYARNSQILEGIIESKPNAMAHPGGFYNDDTLEILSGMGVSLGFRSNMGIREMRSNLEIPRQDHSNVLIEMNRRD